MKVPHSKALSSTPPLVSPAELGIMAAHVARLKTWTCLLRHLEVACIYKTKNVFLGQPTYFSNWKSQFIKGERIHDVKYFSFSLYALSLSGLMPMLYLHKYVALCMFVNVHDYFPFMVTSSIYINAQNQRQYLTKFCEAEVQEKTDQLNQTN